MSSEKITEDRMYRIEPQELSLLDLDLKGLILDIGGGGEGVIGQLFQDKVIAIDPNQSELEEAAEGPLKIVMDARELKFLDHVFDFATSFFTFMFIPNCNHRKVFEEVFRVLKPSGKFIIWDIEIPTYNNGLKDIFVVPLKFNLPKGNLETGYGTRWKEKEQSLEYFCHLAETTGFKVSVKQINGKIIILQLEKGVQIR